MKYNTGIVLAWFADQGIPIPEAEWKFDTTRKWRFDFAWRVQRVALEVQGGIFIAGRHSRGAALLKEWEKLNQAACLGWRILYCQPSEICTVDLADTIREALEV